MRVCPWGGSLRRIRCRHLRIFDRFVRRVRLHLPAPSRRRPLLRRLSAIALMKEILVAKKALAEAFTSSAVARVSHDERDFLVEQLRVNVPSQSFRSSRLRPINSEDQSIRIQRVLDCVSLSEELRIPCHLDQPAPARCQLPSSCGRAVRRCRRVLWTFRRSQLALSAGVPMSRSLHRRTSCRPRYSPFV